jgi:16S rRNA (cytosine1407-C5)-methyltransferase
LNPRFEEYYEAIYGGRWKALRESLLRPAENSDGTRRVNASVPYNGEDDAPLAMPYCMDWASILAALSLRLPREGTVLDACAAPGGKSLVIASRLNPSLTLLSNELSSERRRRLSNVLDQHLGGERRRQVNVSGFDAAAAGSKKQERERFGGILLDAPCSSERHVLNDEGALSKWTPARPKFLAQRQWALLSSAFLLLSPGSSLVYVTCALSPEENDAVSKKLITKYGESLTLDEPDFSEGEKTNYGRIILPDLSQGMGPLYVARFMKK